MAYLPLFPEADKHPELRASGLPRFCVLESNERGTAGQPLWKRLVETMMRGPENLRDELAASLRDLQATPADASEALLFTSAAFANSRELLSELVKLSGVKHAAAMRAAAHSNNVELLRWLSSEGWAVTPDTLKYAAAAGSAEALKWLADSIEEPIDWLEIASALRVGVQVSEPTWCEITNREEHADYYRQMARRSLNYVPDDPHQAYVQTGRVITQRSGGKAQVYRFINDTLSAFDQ